MKQQNIFEIIWEGLTLPLTAMAILIDEDMRVNEDGYWNKHFERMNKKAEKRAKRRAAKKSLLPYAEAPETPGTGWFSNSQKKENGNPLKIIKKGKINDGSEQENRGFC